jgi:hypothetical protein
VTGQTSERSVLSAIVPESHPAGNKVPTVRSEVGVDFDNDSDQFRLGPIRNLEVRVEEAFRRGAIAYVPSQSRRFDPTGKG